VFKYVGSKNKAVFFVRNHREVARFGYKLLSKVWAKLLPVCGVAPDGPAREVAVINSAAAFVNWYQLARAKNLAGATNFQSVFPDHMGSHDGIPLALFAGEAP
jgi:hypothetical protein